MRLLPGNNVFQTKTLLRALIAILLLLFSACATSPKPSQHTDLHRIYSLSPGSSLISTHAPILRVENGDEEYNQIGTVEAYIDDKNREKIKIDTSQATFYGETETFQGQYGSYTNLIYRVHFTRVPLSAIPFSLTYGRNVGLFIIVTLNEDEKPVLVTTVHTCGCYVAFVPTNHMIENAYRKDWPKLKQRVFGETLPARIQLDSDTDRIIVDIRDRSHRIHEISVAPPEKLSIDRQNKANLAPIKDLRQLPLGDSTVSMFQNQGPRKGYVKGSSKPFEALLMSWWAFDPFIGVDKDYGDPEKTGTIFYTSLKPWNRKASNMWPFTDFLEFWGWSL